MCGKLFAFLFLIIALILAVAASVLPQDRLASIIYASRFFDVMIPVLAVGALIKYLFTCRFKSCAKCETKEVIDTTSTRI